MKEFDVIIVGAGPAGLAAAKQLDSKLNLAIIEKGKSLEERTSITSGFGGSGLFSDGKLIISDSIGGNLKDYTKNPYKYIELASQLCGIKKEEYSWYPKNVDTNLIDTASKYGLELIPSNVVHLGTDGSRKLIKNLYQELNQKCKIYINSEVIGIYQEKQTSFYVSFSRNCIKSKYLILAPGREGSKWLSQVLRDFKIKVEGNKVDLGIRLELPTKIVSELLEFNRDFKIKYYTKEFNDLVRTFCVCKDGEVVKEEFDNLSISNGQSYKIGKTKNTNFALLVSIPFSHPISPNNYGHSIVELANDISPGIIIQRFGDLIDGKRSTEDRIKNNGIKPTLNAYPGDLSLVLPYRYLTDIKEMILQLDAIAPGIASRNTLMYGVEAKFYSNILQLNEMETIIPNLFCCGDGAGVSRGIIQAMASGITAAEVINGREN